MTTIQEIPWDRRAQTGPTRIGDDWCGVFIRGDNAAYYAVSLRGLLDRIEKLPDGVDRFFGEHMVRQLCELLESSDERGHDRQCTYRGALAECHASDCPVHGDISAEEAASALTRATGFTHEARKNGCVVEVGSGVGVGLRAAVRIGVGGPDEHPGQFRVGEDWYDRRRDAVRAIVGSDPETLAAEVAQWDSGQLSPQDWEDIPGRGPGLLTILREFARRADVGVQDLVMNWVDDRIRDERSKLRGDAPPAPIPPALVELRETTQALGTGQSNRRVVCAANRQGDRVAVGPRHASPLMRINMHALGIEWNAGLEQGFVDQWGIFMDRSEALRVAIEAGQVPASPLKTELFSEDLY